MRNPLTVFMRKSLRTIGLGMALLSAALFPAAAAPPGRVSLRGHVPAAISRLQAKGQLAATNQLYLAIGLPLRNQSVLTNLLRQIYDPASPYYRHYLTPEEFTAQFGPTEQDYQAVIAFAKANGFEIAGTHSNRVLLDVRARTPDVEKAFNVTLRTYRHPSENRDFFAPDKEPSIPSGLPVLDVSGLNDYSLPHPMLHKKTTASPAAGSGPSGGYMGADFRNAYVPGSSLTGAGQIVGLLQLDGYYQSDITTYERLAGLPNVPLQNILLDGFNGTPGINNDEVCLDIEMAISMAPGLSGVVVFEAGPNGAFNDVLNSMAANSQIKQFSSSWGYSGSPNSTADQIFLQMAAQGQSFFQASGDGDAWVNPIWTPADSPYATIVAGTTLTMSGLGGAYSSETVWNAGLLLNQSGNPDPWFANGNGYWGSGGGVSTINPIPSWQANVSMTANLGSTTMRNIPDVAMTGDNVFVVSSGGSQSVVMGTSCAAPLWAGFTALVNQQAAAQGVSPVGFLNPSLYAIGASANYASCFKDITTGNNFWPGSPNQYRAVPGYDLCTGLGTPNGINLINALTALSGNNNSIVFASPPLPPYGTNLAGLSGGNPNGPWNLFVQDDVFPFAGAISNGWVLTLTTASPVGAAADNQLLMTASSGNIALGGNVTYTVAVTNYGPSGSTNVLVTDTLQSGFTLVASNATQGSISGSGTQLNWNIGTLATNAGAQLTVTVKPASNGNFTNSATVTSLATPDPNPDDNSDSASVAVGSAAPPRLFATAANSNGTFQFAVTNAPGQMTIVQASTNLVTWIPIYTNTVGGAYTFTDPNATGYPRRFYRVIAPSP